MAVSGLAVFYATAGGVLLWSGFKGQTIRDTLKAITTSNAAALAAKGGQAVGGVTLSTSGTSGGSGGMVPGVQASALPSAGRYDRAQLEALWIQAGGSQATAANAACHALQESGGDPQVTSRNPDGGTNVGLWQLDTKGKGTGYTVAQLQNALNNARITVFATGNGRDWSAWATPGC